MTLEEFESLVASSLELLPQEFRDILAKNQITVIVRKKAPRPVRNSYPSSIVYGIFIGVPYGRFYTQTTEPTRIELYQESFERSFSTDDEIRHEVQRTVVHEVGHYFGFTEAQLRKLGY